MAGGMCEQWIGAESPIFRRLANDVAGRERLTFVENLGPIGVSMPPGLVCF